MWCLSPDGPFDLSHVIPASCGNNELVLPSPIVCEHCNGSFKKIERVFAAEPEFNFKAALLGVPNARTGKPFTHDRFGVTEKLPPREPGTNRAFVAGVHLNLNMQDPPKLEVIPSLTVNEIEVPLPPVTTVTTLRWVELYSRSVYKILFEWYAHHYYVTGRIRETSPAPTDERFHGLRRFVKCGQPQGNPRMLIRWYETTNNTMDWWVDENSDVLLTEMNLMGTHYIGALAGNNAVAEQRLNELIERIPRPALVFSDNVRATGAIESSLTTLWRL